ncbi:hypothetical protein C0J45_23797, partial [Silurus meridionalis]
MAAHASELELAKKNLTDVIGDNIKHS